jgi:hypothetical protein
VSSFWTLDWAMDKPPENLPGPSWHGRKLRGTSSLPVQG